MWGFSFIFEVLFSDVRLVISAGRDFSMAVPLDGACLAGVGLEAEESPEYLFFEPRASLMEF